MKRLLIAVSFFSLTDFLLSSNKTVDHFPNIEFN